MQLPLNLFIKSKVINKANFYIAFNKETSGKTVISWQKTYQKLYKAKVIEAIFTKHNMLNLYPKKMNFTSIKNSVVY